MLGGAVPPGPGGAPGGAVPVRAVPVHRGGGLFSGPDLPAGAGGGPGKGRDPPERGGRAAASVYQVIAALKIPKEEHEVYRRLLENE